MVGLRKGSTRDVSKILPFSMTITSFFFSLLSFILHAFAFICRKLKITTFAQRFLLRVLASGPVPQHVAFVMDGNRRYARMHGKQVQEGHGEGYLALKRVCFHSIVSISFLYRITSCWKYAYVFGYAVYLCMHSRLRISSGHLRKWML